MYWDEASDEDRRLIRKYVSSGRLELVNGAVSMSDLLLPQADDILDNFLSGREWLLENDIVPLSKTAWFVDDFGIQPANLKIIRSSGFDNLVINRIHYAEKDRLRRNQKLVFDWETGCRSTVCMQG